MRVLPGLTALWIALSACDDRALAWDDWPREQALGVSFALPPHMAHGVDGNEIALRDTRNIRRPEWIRLSLDDEIPAQLLGDNHVVAEGTKPAPYTIIERGSGSGGMEYGLSTSKKVGNRTVLIFANVQTEEGVPDFPTAWAVWESLQPIN